MVVDDELTITSDEVLQDFVTTLSHELTEQKVGVSGFIDRQIEEQLKSSVLHIQYLQEDEYEEIKVRWWHDHSFYVFWGGWWLLE